MRSGLRWRRRTAHSSWSLPCTGTLQAGCTTRASSRGWLQSVARELLPVGSHTRLLALATVIDAVGSSMYLSAGAIFLVRSAGLSPSQVGVGLTIGALIGFGVGPKIGDLADLRGPRRILMACLVVQAGATTLLLLVRDVPVLVLSAAIAAAGKAGADSARGALIGAISEERTGARLRSYLRAVTNVGLAVGTVGAAFVLAVDTRPAYVAMIFANTVSFVFAAMVISRLPPMSPTRPAATANVGSSSTRWTSLRDRRYLALTATTSIAGLQYWVLIYALPLWVTEHTATPRWLAAALFLLAAVIVAAIQVPATRSITDAPSAARLIALSGPLFCLAWVTWVLASEPPTVAAAVLLVLGVVLHSVAEVWQAAGAFELSFALARREALGQYQGIYGLGHQLVEAVAPFVVISLCVSWGKPGWIVVALIVTLAGFASAAVSRMSEPSSQSGSGGNRHP